MKKFALAMLLLFIAAHPSDLSSCGPFFSEAVFTRVRVPGNEVAFFKGKLGILQPTLWRAYLAMAYRTLSGLPLTETEAESVRQRREAVSEGDTGDPLKTWLEQRMTVPGAQRIDIQQYRTNEDYQGFLWCGNDAFVTATKTLRSLPAGEAKIWLAAQDEVFSNCGLKGTIPERAEPGSSEGAVANREYQIAAAHFYAGDLDEAKALFQKIAADEASPWRTIAPYLVARVDLRRADYAGAASDLKSILQKPDLHMVHEKARRLLDYAEARRDPAAYMGKCAKQLMEPGAADLAHALRDYTYLYDHFKDLSAGPDSRYRPEDLSQLVSRDELTRWIETFGGERALEEWKQRHSLPWLVSAITYATGPLAEAPALVEAALEVPASSPAYASVRFQAVRILIGNGEQERARAVLADVAPHTAEFPISAQNAFRAEHLELARNFDEFLAFAPRTLAGEQSDEVFESDAAVNEPPLSSFDRDATGAFNNKLPLPYWLRALRTPKLAGNLRVELAQSGLVRALLTKNSLSAEFAKDLARLKPGYSAGLGEYLNAGKGEREFAATFWMLHHPELNPWIRTGFQRLTKDGRIDSFRDNWWCPQKEAAAAAAGEASFLTEADRERAAAENEALNSAADAQKYLASAVVSHAHAHPGDPRLPEALALAVKSSRYGCSEADSEKPVSEAFRILHRRFPDNEWAKRTPYWYK